MKRSKGCYKCMCIVHIHIFIRLCRKYDVLLMSEHKDGGM